MMRLVVLALCAFAVPISCGVIQLDNSNFDQVQATHAVRARPVCYSPYPICPYPVRERRQSRLC